MFHLFFWQKTLAVNKESNNAVGLQTISVKIFNNKTIWSRRFFY